jgi:hypothetical protein
VVIDVAPLVSEFNIGPLTLYRRAVNTLDSYGRHVPGAESTLSLTPVAAHPSDTRQINLLPEAMRASDPHTFYTRTAVYTADSGKVPDEIAYLGRRFRLMALADYQAQGGVWIAVGVAKDRIAA